VRKLKLDPTGPAQIEFMQHRSFLDVVGHDDAAPVLRNDAHWHCPLLQLTEDVGTRDAG
jgi:hypothetical protein